MLPESVWVDSTGRECHIAMFPEVDPRWADPELAATVGPVLEVRTAVQAALKRSGETRSSGRRWSQVMISECRALWSSWRYQQDLSSFFVSDVVLTRASPRPEAPSGFAITVDKATGTKCERCWNHRSAGEVPTEHPTLCDRCIEGPMTPSIRYLLLGCSACRSWCWTKSRSYVMETMRLHESIPVITNLFSITYIRNPGRRSDSSHPVAAHSGLSFFGLTSVFAVGLLGDDSGAYAQRRLDGGGSAWQVFSAGGRNLLDRLRYGEVIDFLDFTSTGIIGRRLMSLIQPLPSGCFDFPLRDGEGTGGSARSRRAIRLPSALSNFVLSIRPAGDDEPTLLRKLPLLLDRKHDERFAVAELAFFERNHGLGLADSTRYCFASAGLLS